MLSPSEYITKAIRNVQNVMMRECTKVLRFGDCSVCVVQVNSTRSQSGAGEWPYEDIRVVGAWSDFTSELKRGEFVMLGDDLRIVTSIRRDPTGASVFVGMSPCYHERTVKIEGLRKMGRRVSVCVGCGVIDIGMDDAMSDGSIGANRKRVSIAIMRDSWPNGGMPQIGDSVVMDDGSRYSIFAVETYSDGPEIVAHRIEARQT